MSITARDYETDADLRAMQALQQELWALEGERAHTHVGDLAWWARMHVGREHEWKRRLWFDGGRCVAWAWLDRPASLDYQVHLEHRGNALHEDVLDWFESEAEGSAPLTALAMDGDDATHDVFRRRGFAPAETGKWYAYFVRPLDDDLSVATPAEFTLRTVRALEDVHERVEVHRAVWAPSRVTEESYGNVMATWPYRADLDCVLEAPDGTFAAYALAWYDEQNRVGELEPVGVRPDCQRRGFGRVVCTYAFRRLRDVGATKAIVYAVTDDTCAFYESLGFRRHTTVRELRKERT